MLARKGVCKPFFIPTSPLAKSACQIPARSTLRSFSPSLGTEAFFPFVLERSPGDDNIPAVLAGDVYENNSPVHFLLLNSPSISADLCSHLQLQSHPKGIVTQLVTSQQWHPERECIRPSAKHIGIPFARARNVKAVIARTI